jgi:hypothetical protein
VGKQTFDETVALKSWVLLFAAVMASRGLSWAHDRFCIVSPDHPAVWYNRSGDKVQQELVWSRSRQVVEADVAFDEVNFWPERDQTYYDRFTLSFPTLRLDRATGRFYFCDRKGHRHEIGSLRADGFGTRVVLDPSVQFSTFRRNDVVRAAIGSAPLPVRE